MPKVEPHKKLINRDQTNEQDIQDDVYASQQIPSLGKWTGKTPARLWSSHDDEFFANVRKAAIMYDPDTVADEIFHESDIEPSPRGFVIFFVLVLASLGGIFLALLLAVFLGWPFLSTLAVYYAVANAMILTSLVVYALLNLEEDVSD